jgi:hypothetical protein
VVPTGIRRDGDAIVLSFDAPDDGSPGSATAVPVGDFRDRINAAIQPPPAGLPKAVPSVRFDVIAIDGGAVLQGRGWGHGIGMSQWGAYGKAARGMRAPDILAAYYAGVRPTTLPPSEVPQRIKVAVDIDRPFVDLLNTAPGGRFRITAGDGTVLAHAATGQWRIAPVSPNRIRVVPPPDQAGSIGVEHVITSPADPKPGQRITLTVRLPDDALVTVTAAPPTTDTATALAEPKLLAAGKVTLRLPPAQAPGTYQVAIATDRGGGRVTTTSVPVQVADPQPPSAISASASGLAPVSEGEGRVRALVIVLAMSSLAAAVGATARALFGLIPRRQLH